MPAAFREVRKYTDVELDADVISQAASHARMKVVKTDNESLTLKVGLNFWSFGETIHVVLGYVDGVRVVDVSSRCALKTQIVDWGKNERNVRKLFDAIDKVLGPTGWHTQCWLCSNCGYLLIDLKNVVCSECGHTNQAGDGADIQDTATLKKLIIAVLMLAIVEVVLVAFIKAIGVNGKLIRTFGGYRGAILILFINAVTLLPMGLLHRFAKKRLNRRRDSE